MVASMSAGFTIPFSTSSDSRAFTRSAMSDGTTCDACRGWSESVDRCAPAVGAKAAAPKAARLRNPRRPTPSDDFLVINDSAEADSIRHGQVIGGQSQSRLCRTLRFGLFRRRGGAGGTDRESVQLESVTYVLGIICHPCDRKIPLKNGRDAGI